MPLTALDISQRVNVARPKEKKSQGLPGVQWHYRRLLARALDSESSRPKTFPISRPPSVPLSPRTDLITADLVAPLPHHTSAAVSSFSFPFVSQHSRRLSLRCRGCAVNPLNWTALSPTPWSLHHSPTLLAPLVDSGGLGRPFNNCKSALVRSEGRLDCRNLSHHSCLTTICQPTSVGVR